MKFSDMMGSGGDRPPKHKDETESETAIANAIAPYLDTRPEPAPAKQPAEPIAPIASVEPFAPPAPPAAPTAPAEPIAAPTEYAAPLPPAAATRPVAPPEPPEPRRAWQPERPVAADAAEGFSPLAVSTATVSTATAVADFTPLSDDLLPSRRR